MDEPTNKYTIPLAIVAAGALVAGAIYFGDSGQTATGSRRPIADSTTNIEVPNLNDEDHIRGSSDAKFFIVEYSDTECPFCKVFHDTMKQVLNDNPEVAWVYRHFPIPSLHSKAVKESEATECAAELGGNQGFWDYLDEIFAVTGSNDTLDPAELPRIAGRTGLDITAFNDCLASGRHNEKVLAQMKDAVSAGARGTPYSLILNRKGEVKGVINGAEPYASIKIKLDALEN